MFLFSPILRSTFCPCQAVLQLFACPSLFYPTFVLSYISPVLHLFCPTFVLSYISSVLRFFCPTLVLSHFFPVLPFSCPAFFLSYIFLSFVSPALHWSCPTLVQSYFCMSHDCPLYTMTSHSLSHLFFFLFLLNMLKTRFSLGYQLFYENSRPEN